MAGLEYNITKGGTKQPGSTLAFYNANCKIDADFIELEQSAAEPRITSEVPDYCASFLIGRTWSFAPYYWNSVAFSGNMDPIVLQDFNIGLKYYATETITPNVDPLDPLVVIPPTVTRTYADFVIVSQTLVMTNATNAPADRDIFTVQPNSDNIYTLQPGTYPSDVYQVVGINNGAAYEYASVFNESNISYIPRLAPGGQGVVEDDPPTAPLNRDEGVYPLGTLTGYVPDPRPSVTLTYTLTTSYHPSDNPDGVLTDTITITQVVTQPEISSDTIGRKIKSYLEQSYYTKKRYNFSLWEVEEDPLYERDGDPVDPVPRYNEATNSYYDQNTNGEGFNGL